jgi:hypothetical protein
VLTVPIVVAAVLLQIDRWKQLSRILPKQVDVLATVLATVLRAAEPAIRAIGIEGAIVERGVRPTIVATSIVSVMTVSGAGQSICRITRANGGCIVAQDSNIAITQDGFEHVGTLIAQPAFALCHRAHGCRVGANVKQLCTHLVLRSGNDRHEGAV